MKRIICLFIIILASGWAVLAQDQPGTVKFPAGIDSPDSLFRAADNARSTLASSITTGATTVPLASASSFPASGSAIIESGATYEVIYYTSKSGNSLIGVTRGAQSTTPLFFPSGSTVRSPVLAVHHNTQSAAIQAAETKIGSGACVAANGKFLKGTGPGASCWGDILIADVSGLQAALDSKAASAHTHGASDTTSGVFNTARLGTGTADSTKYLRGDGSWTTLPAATPGGNEGDFQIKSGSSFAGVGSTGTSNVVRADNPTLTSFSVTKSSFPLIHIGASGEPKLHINPYTGGLSGYHQILSNAYYNGSFNFDDGSLFAGGLRVRMTTGRAESYVAFLVSATAGSASLNEVFKTDGDGNGTFTGSAIAPKFCFTGTVCEYAGAGSPEGVITGGIGATYRNTTNGDLYRKSSGAGNTGWVRNSPGGSSGEIQFNDSGAFGGSLLKQSTNTIEQYNSTSAQTASIYNTRTDASNYERFSTTWISNIAFLRTENAGTGSSRPIALHGSTIYLQNAAALGWQISSGHLQAQVDGGVDIGAAGGNRPANVFAQISTTAPKHCYTATVCDFAGAGSPEGVVTGGIGSTYRNTTNGDLYRKTSGAGNTGWTTP